MSPSGNRPSTAPVACRLRGAWAASQGGPALTLYMDALATRHAQLGASSTRRCAGAYSTSTYLDSCPLSNYNRGRRRTDSRPSRQTRSDRPITTPPIPDSPQRSALALALAFYSFHHSPCLATNRLAQTPCPSLAPDTPTRSPNRTPRTPHSTRGSRNDVSAPASPIDPPRQRFTAHVLCPVLMRVLRMPDMPVEKGEMR